MTRSRSGYRQGNADTGKAERRAKNHDKIIDREKCNRILSSGTAGGYVLAAIDGESCFTARKSLARRQFLI